MTFDPYNAGLLNLGNAKAGAGKVSLAERKTPSAHPAIQAMRSHGWVYLAEAALLALFMISACAFTVIFEYPGSPVRHAISSPLVRRALNGTAMGLTAIALIYSRWGKRSGAHMNPAVTLCFLRIGKIDVWDAVFYIVAQFTGAAVGVGFSRVVAESVVTHPAINDVVTLPGNAGISAAWIAEFGISFVLMATIVSLNRFPRLIAQTGIFVGLLLAVYITFEAPISGTSMNPARTLGSALFAEVFTGIWVYFTAPTLGMLAAVELYRWLSRSPNQVCAKLNHSRKTPCIIKCNCLDAAATDDRAPKVQLPKDPTSYPLLDARDLAALRELAEPCYFKDRDTIFHAGQCDLDLFVVQSGGIDIINPSDNERHIVTHFAGDFSGDIDLLTGRSMNFTGLARGETILLRVPSARMRELLTKIPSLSEKLLIACMERHQSNMNAGTIGMKVIGPGKCRDTTVVREFLFKNFVPFTWYDSVSDSGKTILNEMGDPKRSPIVQTTDHRVLINPSLRDLAQSAGIWRACSCEYVDLAVIGAGPAGMTAAVYAASEGLSTLVLDRLGPGGQAASSSKIENFIGFPNGISGAELAIRSVIQMLKFGAKIAAPVNVQRITSDQNADYHHIQLDCGTNLRARTILIAAGVAWRKLAAEGSEKYEGAGIHYACTSVEAMLYDKQDVAVVGAGNSAGQAAMYLSESCPDREVHLVIRKRLGAGMSEYLVKRIQSAKNITILEGVEIAAVHGSPRLEAVTIRAYDPDSNFGGTRPDTRGQILRISAVFVFIGADPGCAWLPESIARDNLGYILTGVDALRCGRWPLNDREPCPLETTLPGVLAAGDIRSGSTKRVGFAVGDGALAVTCVHKLTAIRR